MSHPYSLPVIHKKKNINFRSPIIKCNSKLLSIVLYVLQTMFGQINNFVSSSHCIRHTAIDGCKSNKTLHSSFIQTETGANGVDPAFSSPFWFQHKKNCNPPKKCSSLISLLFPSLSSLYITFNLNYTAIL